MVAVVLLFDVGGCLGVVVVSRDQRLFGESNSRGDDHLALNSRKVN